MRRKKERRKHNGRNFDLRETLFGSVGSESKLNDFLLSSPFKVLWKLRQETSLIILSLSLSCSDSLTRTHAFTYTNTQVYTPAHTNSTSLTLFHAHCPSYCHTRTNTLKHRRTPIFNTHTHTHTRSSSSNLSSQHCPNPWETIRVKIQTSSLSGFATKEKRELRSSFPRTFKITRKMLLPDHLCFLRNTEWMWNN